MKQINRVGRISKILIAAGVFYSGSIFAALPPATPSINAVKSLIPGSAQPAIVSGTLSKQPVNQLQTVAAPEVKKQQQSAAALGPQAEKLKFQLNQVILHGNTVYSSNHLMTIYKNKLHKKISVAELQGLVQDITNYYRNNGYILSRAVLPPQHVSKGIVHVQIVEGFIDQVKIVGNDKGAKRILQAYGNQIAVTRPLQVKVMEHYLLLSNEVPGVQAKAVLEPSKTKTAASDLNLVTDAKKASGYISYDNYGTRYIGPNQVSLGAEADSIFLAGDSAQFSFVTTTRPKELRYGGLVYGLPVGDKGARLAVGANRSKTLPGLVLRPLKINGTSDTIYTQLQYPVLRSRAESLTLDGTFNYIDSTVTTFSPPIALYNDHLRTLKLGGNYYRSDSWYGANSIDFHVENGLPLLGATPESMASSGETSRLGGSGHFAKVNLQASRLQQFGATRFSAFAIMKGQYALEPVLSAEQFGFGGAQEALGRGYDSAEIIGDRGMSGSIELRMNVMPEQKYLQAMQLYTFYDAGVIWNLKNIASQNRKDSATSAGFGSRFFFAKNLTGNLLFAQPLTKEVNALSLLGNGRQPRVFFSLTASA